jgi:O-antigen ligase
MAGAWLCFVALNLQTVTVTGRMTDGAGGPALKLYHLVLLGCGLAFLVRGRIPRWRGEAALYFAVTGATSLLAYLAFGPHAMLANAVFAAYAMTVGTMLGRAAGRTGTVRALRAGGALVVAAVLAKAWVLRGAILAFLAAPNGHPQLAVFYGGGPNLEASWASMVGALFLGSWALVPVALGAGLLSVAYASRVGILVGVLVAAGALARVLARPTPRARVGRWLVPLVVVLVAGGGGAAVARSADSDGAMYVLRRFENIGDEPGSLGRVTLWDGGVRVFARYPLGVGQGNAAAYVRAALGADLGEDNLHNQYLQHLVETGIQGLAAFALLAAVTWWRYQRGRFADPLLLYVLLYLVVSAVQFRGADALVWYVYGLQHGSGDAAARDAASGV